MNKERAIVEYLADKLVSKFDVPRMFRGQVTSFIKRLSEEEVSEICTLMKQLTAYLEEGGDKG